MVWRISAIINFLKLRRFKFIRSINNNYLCDIPFNIIGAKSINPHLLSIVAFGNRIFHRGMPCDPKQFKQLEKEFEKISENSTVPLDVDFGLNNKYIIYFHFVNQLGLNSYIHQQIMENNNNSWDSMKSSWQNEFISRIYQNLFPNSKIMFNKAYSLNQIYEEKTI